MSRRKTFRQSDWPIELSPRKNVEPRIIGIRSTFRGSTFFPSGDPAFGHKATKDSLRNQILLCDMKSLLA